VHGGRGPVWTPDSARLVVPLVPASLSLAAVTTSHGKAQNLSNAWRYEGATVRIFHANAPGSEQASTGLTPRIREGRDLEGDFDLAYVDVATGRAKRVGYVPGGGDYKVSPDGHQIALRVEVATTNNSWNNMRRMDLITDDGTRKTVLPDQINLSGITWSPDGNYLAATTGHYDGPVPHTQVHFVRLKDGQHTQSAEQTWIDFWEEPTWEPNSEYFDLLAYHRQKPTDPEKTIFERVRAADGTFKTYPTDPYESTEGFVRRRESGAPWVPDKNTLVFGAINDATKDAALISINPATGKFTTLREAPEAIMCDSSGGQWLDVSADGQTLVIPKQSFDKPTDYYVFDRSLKNEKRLTNVNPELAKAVFGKAQMVHYQGPKGITLGGILLLPSNYVPGQRYPTILETYPETDPSYLLNYFGGSSFGELDNLEMFATRGYAVFRAQSVILPDGKIAQEIADSMNAAAKKVIDMGIADPNALAITGGSFGGYATLATITRSPMFRAAVVVAGPSNLPGMVGALEDDANGSSVVGAGILKSAYKLSDTLWQNPKRYIDNSPVFDLNKVKAAVLVIHGTEDDRVPVTQGREVYADLSQLGQEVEMRQYDGEEHGSRAFANTADQAYATIHWFDDHLKNFKK
jgi:dipeptidyl aminopeptidase/acylaminoacyl peptidase